jgi:hypothetical protein
MVTGWLWSRALERVPPGFFLEPRGSMRHMRGKGTDGTIFVTAPLKEHWGAALRLLVGRITELRKRRTTAPELRRLDEEIARLNTRCRPSLLVNDRWKAVGADEALRSDATVPHWGGAEFANRGNRPH